MYVAFCLLGDVFSVPPSLPTDACPSPYPYTQMKGLPHSYSWRLTTKGGQKSRPCEHSALEAAFFSEAAHRAAGRRVRTYWGELGVPDSVFCADGSVDTALAMAHMAK